MAFNEVASLEPFTRELESVLEALGTPGEILIIDDGSSDGSTERLAVGSGHISRMESQDLGKLFYACSHRRNLGQIRRADCSLRSGGQPVEILRLM